MLKFDFFIIMKLLFPENLLYLLQKKQKKIYFSKILVIFTPHMPLMTILIISRTVNKHNEVLASYGQLGLDLAFGSSIKLIKTIEVSLSVSFKLFKNKK